MKKYHPLSEKIVDIHLTHIFLDKKLALCTTPITEKDTTVPSNTALISGVLDNPNICTKCVYVFNNVDY